MSDAMDEWRAQVTESQLRHVGSPDLALPFVRAVFDGDEDAARAVIARMACDDDGSNLVNGSLWLCFQTARQYRSDLGMMALHAAMLDAESTAAHRHSRIGAALASGHYVCSDVVAADPLSMVGADPSQIYNYGLAAFNQACEDADRDSEEVFTEAIRLYRRLLPEVSSGAIGVVAQQIWEEA
jgi:hypothetical protein